MTGRARDVAARPSPIEGTGLFALRDFEALETILVRSERDVTDDAPLRPELGEQPEHCDYIDGGRTVHLGTPERHLNHSCVANALIRELPDGRHEIAARRDIAAGEEVTKRLLDEQQRRGRVALTLRLSAMPRQDRGRLLRAAAGDPAQGAAAADGLVRTGASGRDCRRTKAFSAPGRWISPRTVR
jgi:hypothetical protein